MKSLGWTLIQFDWCSYFFKKVHLETETPTRRTTGEDEGRDWGDASQANKCQILPTDYQKLGEMHGIVFLLKAAKVTNPANTLILDF